jgi:hypothetical protein
MNVYVYDDYPDKDDHKGYEGVAKNLNHRYNPWSIHKKEGDNYWRTEKSINPRLRSRRGRRSA